VVWDDSVPLGPHRAPGLFSIYATGRIADTRLTRPLGDAHGVAPERDLGWFFSEVENIYPGLRQAYMGKAFEDNWPASPHHRGALAFWKVGQVTGFSRQEGRREGNALFAGEHTNHGGPGFMNSAIVSGTKVAAAIRLELR
jgi:monoamine oxidase